MRVLLAVLAEALLDLCSRQFTLWSFKLTSKMIVDRCGAVCPPAGEVLARRHRAQRAQHAELVTSMQQAFRSAQIPSTARLCPLVMFVDVMV